MKELGEILDENTIPKSLSKDLSKINWIIVHQWWHKTKPYTIIKSLKHKLPKSKFANYLDKTNPIHMCSKE